MTSKEALEKLLKIAYIASGPTKEKFITYEKEIEHNQKCLDLYNIISQDLNQLQMLEKKNEDLKEKLKISEENEETVLTTLEIAVQENQKLKNTILSLELDTCIPELRKENTKLKNVIEIFKGFSLGLTMYGGSETSYGLEANNSIILTREQFELLKEVLENEVR